VLAPEHGPIHGMPRWKIWQEDCQLDVVDRRRGPSGRMIGCRWIYGRLGGDLVLPMVVLDLVYSDQDEVLMDDQRASGHLCDTQAVHSI
jgi:hypothetical protein